MFHHLVASSLVLLLSQSAAATIYTCTDKNGRRHTADRPIEACHGVAHRVLNADGSLQTIVAPAMSPQERLVFERQQRAEERERQAEQELIKRDRLLLRRYPNREVHEEARLEALRLVHSSVESSERRIEALQIERKKLLEEAASHEGKALPGKLKQQLNAIEATLLGQQSLVQNQSRESSRINALYDAEVRRLDDMWKALPPTRP